MRSSCEPTILGGRVPQNKFKETNVFETKTDAFKPIASFEQRENMMDLLESLLMRDPKLANQKVRLFEEGATV